MTELKPERVKELREWGRILHEQFEQRRLSPAWGNTDLIAVHYLLSILDSCSSMRAENDKLITDLSHHQHDLFYERQEREKAEAELEKQAPLPAEDEHKIGQIVTLAVPGVPDWEKTFELRDYFRSQLSKGAEWERRYAELVETVAQRTDQAKGDKPKVVSREWLFDFTAEVQTMSHTADITIARRLRELGIEVKP
jgi:hypothetical protein